MHRRFEESAVTEDDINEVKSDISAMRYEMLEIFEKNGMDISGAEKKEKAHLAKRMKIWERRLMKDFHVTPMAGEEEAEPISHEKGIARFRRVAKQIANQTATHRWGETIRGVTDTQIGRCRNRSSFQNQQNLQRAMDEAKRLVSRSPIQSRPCTPVEFYDPTTNTLLELLKNIREEVGEPSPQNTTSNALTQQLQELIRSRTPSPFPPFVSQMAESGPQTMQADCKRKSISSNLSLSIDGADKKFKSPSPTPSNRNRSKSPAPRPQQRKSVSSISSQNLSGEEKSTGLQLTPPIIQITRNDSVKSKESCNDFKLGNDSMLLFNYVFFISHIFIRSADISIYNGKT